MVSSSVAIMGCGPGGAYLYRLLRLKKPLVQISVFDAAQSNNCGVKGCAWGVSWVHFSAFCTEVGLKPERYALGLYDHGFINGQRLTANIAIIDKPLFIKDLLGGTIPLDYSNANPDEFGRIVDATGTSRAYLSPRPELPLVATLQIKVNASPVLFPEVHTMKGGGYTWIFPIGSAQAHIGALSPRGPDAAKEALNELRSRLGGLEIVCTCRGQIRCHGPVRPFIEGRVWGLGEAIGLVDPVAGAGIVQAIDSARMMSENWDNPVRYERQVWRTFSYMATEARAANSLASGGKPSLKVLFLPRRAFESIGITPHFQELANIVLKTRKLL